jgi:uncharacterized membrane protein HdeD (DUF308 family)
MLDRHPTDFAQLFFGVVFLALGASFVVHETTDRAFDSGWVAAIALVSVGVAFLALTLLRRPRPERPDES